MFAAPIRAVSASHQAVLSPTSVLRLSRSYAVKATNVAAAAASPSSKESEVSNTASLPSAAPPGTILAGVSILKDRADPVALEDSEYPAWLFKLLDDPSISSSSSLSSIQMASMTKGEARVAMKRQVKALRAERLIKERTEARAAERARLRGQTDPASGAVSPLSLTKEAVSQSEAEAIIRNEALTTEATKHKALRKANRDAIKAKNFVSAT